MAAARWEETFVNVDDGVRIQTLFQPGAEDKLAIIGHPLGRLGGSYDDHVVRCLAGHLHSRHGYSVVLINSRGVGGSSGSPSFSSLPEAEDYRKVVKHYLDLSSVPSETVYNDAVQARPAKREVLLCGYSAGSLAASMCDLTDYSATIRPKYILISYPVSVLFALTLFRTSPFTTAMNTLANGSMPVLSIRGTDDQFSGNSAYAKWESRLMSAPARSSFKAVSLEGVDHFYGAPDDRRRLLEEVDIWIREGSF